MAKMRPNPKLEHKPHGFSCMGEHYVPDQGGWIDIPKPMIDIARQHGYISGEEMGVYTVQTQKASTDLSNGMTRRQMIAYCASNDLKIPDGISIDGLRQFITNHMSEEAA